MLICRESDHYSAADSCSVFLYLRLGAISSLPHALLHLRSQCDEVMKQEVMFPNQCTFWPLLLLLLPSQIHPINDSHIGSACDYQ